MKHIDYCYFNIYSLLSRSNQLGSNFHTRIQAMYLFSIGSGGWLLLGQSLYLHLIRHAWFASKGLSMLFAVSLYLLTAAFFHYIFIVQDRDQKIFGKYEGREHPQNKLHSLLSLGVMVLPYIGMVCCAVVFRGTR